MTKDETPRWVLDEQEHIGRLLDRAEELRGKAELADTDYHRNRFLSEADLFEEDATFSQQLMQARLGGDAAEIAQVETDLQTFRQHWRGIRVLQQSGTLHEFAAVAAEKGA